jgi:hypothetical protein
MKAVSVQTRWCLAWGGVEFRSLAQQSFQLVRGEQLVLCVFLIKDVVDNVASASELQLLQGRSKKFALDQCIQRERHALGM